MEKCIIMKAMNKESEENTGRKLDIVQHINRPVLLLIRGIPGSGKSYLARKLREVIGEDHVAILDPDSIDKNSKEYRQFSHDLTIEGVDEKLHPYRFSRSRAFDAIASRKIAIWNQGFMDFDGLSKTAEKLKEFASDHQMTLTVLIVEVEADEETVRSRVKAREERGGHGVSDEAFARFIGSYKSFSGRGYNTLTIRGEADATASAASVLKAVEALQKK